MTIFLLIVAGLTILFAVIGAKETEKCETDEERRITKAKWQLICGLMGVACIICAAVAIYIMFRR